MSEHRKLQTNFTGMSRCGLYNLRAIAHSKELRSKEKPCVRPFGLAVTDRNKLVEKYSDESFMTRRHTGGRITDEVWGYTGDRDRYGAELVIRLEKIEYYEKTSKKAKAKRRKRARKAQAR